MKFKKILAGAMAGTMVLASVTGVSAATVTVSNTAWWDAWTPTFEIADGETLELKVDLTVAGTEVYQTLNAVFVTVPTDGVTYPSAENIDGYYEYVVLRSDAYGWGDYYSSTTYTGTDYLYNADITDYSTIMTGATYDITITKNGQTVTYDYVITEADGETQLSCGYEFVVDTYDENDSAYVFFTGDAGVTFTITYGIEINADDTIGLVVGNTTTLDVTYLPSSLETSVEFTSSDENVATVDSTGTITGVAEGSAVITATSGDYSDTVNVNVSESENLITGVTAVASSTELTVGGAATLTPSYVAADSTAVTTENNYSYSYEVTSGTDVISVDSNGTVTALAAGNGTVTVTVTCESGTFTTTVDFTVTEAESEEASESTDSDSSDTSDDSSTEEAETETEETVTTVEESETMTLDTFWTTFTSGYEVTEDMLTLTFTTTSTGSNYYNNAIWALYSSDSGYICTAGESSDAATEDNYVEYWVGRADYSGWGSATSGTADSATVEVTATPDDWDAWFAATQAGATVTITAQLDGSGNAVITCACEGYEYTITVPVDADSSVYLALSGEACVLSDLTVNGESANFPILVQAAVTTDDTETTDTETETETTSTTDGTGSSTTTTKTVVTSGSTTGSANTGDASPIIPIAVAVLGCAVVVVASKKRMA